MDNTNEAVYVIPAKYRKMENMHIVFWLLKDISWCMIWKVLGIAMIIPTLTIAIIIAWRTRDIKSELAHNLAILFLDFGQLVLDDFRIFEGFDTTTFWGVEGKHLAMIPFVIGAVILVWYYLVQKPKEEQEEQVATM